MTNNLSKRPRRPSRKPGRPTGTSPCIRQALVDAARKLFAERGFTAASLRQVAEAANVNPAMISYYFGGKEGLYEAVLEEAVAPMLARLTALAEHPADGGASIGGFLEGYTRTMAANPWIPQLIVREVLSEGGKFRERFIQQFASRGGGLLLRLLTSEIQAKRLRDDLDPSLATLALIGMALFPFIAYPVAREVFGLEMNAKLVERLIAHNTQLFLEGAESRNRRH
jgi:TetR/AcrR family transcriptional regulator